MDRMYEVYKYNQELKRVMVIEILLNNSDVIFYDVL